MVVPELARSRSHDPQADRATGAAQRGPAVHLRPRRADQDAGRGAGEDAAAQQVTHGQKEHLVPVRSSSSLRALEFAADRFRRGEYAGVLVLNVQPTLPPSRFVTRSMIAEHIERQSAEALDPARRTARRAGVNATFHVEKGEPAEVIVKFARRHDCDEIVMGTRGQGRVRGCSWGPSRSRWYTSLACPSRS